MLRGKYMDSNNDIELKPIKDILGMNFFIPNYQRGYRWKEQQVIDLLEDIYSFSLNHTDQSEEIYCIQPLVVAQRDEDILTKCKLPETTLEDIRKYINGSWTVVDGQQRLTTIYLILKALDVDEGFEIEYSTRSKSKEFLEKIEDKNEDDSIVNFDFFHMFKAYNVIRSWLEDPKEKEDHKKKKEIFKSTLLNRVHFIWYKVDPKEEIKVFQRLNIGKIPLTDSELIKALFLNRSNFGSRNEKYDHEIDSLQRTIAFEWDSIEQRLQNEEFWAFINNFDYPKPTRIDLILDTICSKNDYELNEEDLKRIGNDEHKTFRYFNEVFVHKKIEEDTKWIKDLWSTIKMYYQVFDDWYNDYRLYHYIGYLSTISSSNFNVYDLVSKWNEGNKDSFLDFLKAKKIKKIIKSKKWLINLEDYQFDQEYGASKRECVELLLLHNIETIIQQNDKLISDSKYNLPNFSKFPFHLFKKEKWEVEHIRPNAGDDLEGDKKVMYLLLAKPYMKINKDLYKDIECYLQTNNENDNDDSKFFELLDRIYKEGCTLSDEDKNKIWNFTLLDATTNKEYGNQIFPFKRALIINKMNGIKKQYSLSNNKELIEQIDKEEVAFVPPCTQYVFFKTYNHTPTTMVNWAEDDAKAYLDDIKEKLKYYLSEDRNINGGQK